MAWEDGAWFGSISEAEQKAGGAWVIGNKPHCSGPDFPGLVDMACYPLVKIWFATPDRYGKGRYPLKDRLDIQRGEYVRVLTGRLDCLVCIAGRPFKTWRLEYPADGINLPPNWQRQWELPNDVSHATGITVCHHELTPWGSVSDLYELLFWDTAAVSSLLALEGPVNMRTWRYQLIVPFHGGCFLSPGLCSSNRPVLSGEYVFLRVAERPKWTVQPSFQARGVVIYF